MGAAQKITFIFFEKNCGEGRIYSEISGKDLILNDNKIIQQIKDKDERAIGLLMAKYTRLLWKTAGDILHRIGSDADAEEVVADVFIHIWKNPERFDAARSSLKNYLCMLCRSKAIDRFRVLSRNAAEDIDALSISDYLGLEEFLIQKEEIRCVNAAIKTLSEEEQDVLLRRLLYEQKPGEIAKATGLSVRKVENIVYRSKIKIRDFVSNKG